MAVNFERIRPSIDVDRLQASHATIVGGGYTLARNLVRCGLGGISLVDFARISATDAARQELPATPGRYKTEATAEALRDVNPDVDVESHMVDYCALSRDRHDALFGHTDLLIFAADSFPAQARGNIEAQRLQIPAVWVGLYRAGRAGEIVFSVPGVTQACYRCICTDRYTAFRKGMQDVPSQGGTILDLHLVDAIAGQMAVGILTRGAPNRFGRLIEQLGNRNLLQVKIDPEYRLGEKDIFAQYLGSHPANFSFTTIALPMERDPRCPDCHHLYEREQASA